MRVISCWQWYCYSTNMALGSFTHTCTCSVAYCILSSFECGHNIIMQWNTEKVSSHHLKYSLHLRLFITNITNVHLRECREISQHDIRSVPDSLERIVFSTNHHRAIQLTVIHNKIVYMTCWWLKRTFSVDSGYYQISCISFSTCMYMYMSDILIYDQPCHTPNWKCV